MDLGKKKSPKQKLARNSVPRSVHQRGMVLLVSVLYDLFPYALQYVFLCSVKVVNINPTVNHFIRFMMVLRE